MELSQRLKKFVTEYRARCKKSDDERDKDLPHDIPEVERIDDLSYGSDKWHTLDVYLPKRLMSHFLSSSISTVVVGFTAPKKLTNITA